MSPAIEERIRELERTVWLLALCLAHERAARLEAEEKAVKKGFLPPQKAIERLANSEHFRRRPDD